MVEPDNRRVSRREFLDHRLQANVSVYMAALQLGDTETCQNNANFAIDDISKEGGLETGKGGSASKGLGVVSIFFMDFCICV